MQENYEFQGDEQEDDEEESSEQEKVSRAQEHT